MVSAAVTAIAAAIAAFLIWRKKAPTTTALLALVVGAGITGGIFGRLVHAIVHWLERFTSTLTSEAFGTAVPAVLGVFLFLWLLHDLHPKHKASHGTAGVALVLPLIAATIPGVAGTVAVSLLQLIQSAMTAFVQALFGG